MAVALPTLLDCDPGTDDAIAILLALASPELDLQAITVAGGNLGLARTLENAACIVGLAGARTPIFAGADHGLLAPYIDAASFHGEDGLGGLRLPPGPKPGDEIAADAIRRILRAAPAPMTLIGIAPATNLALALITEPALAGRVGELVLMSGAWAEGNTTPAAEFNAFNDPEALAILLAFGLKPVLATLELTAQALVTPERIAALRGQGDGRCLAAACDMLAACPPSRRLGGRGTPLHDPCAIAWTIRPDLFGAREVAVEIDLSGPSRGRTVIDRWGRGAAPNATLLERLDADGFFALLGERLARLP